MADKQIEETDDKTKQRHLAEKKGEIKRPLTGPDKNTPDNPEAKIIRHKAGVG